MEKPTVTIYSDGGAMPNPGPGGWGVVLIFEKDGQPITKELSGGAEATTNNRMELTAAIEALRALKQACHIEFYTDSQYLRKGISEWITKWKLNGFNKGKIENVDLWQALDLEANKHEISWHWVKGHAGNQYNERVDRLATEARPKQQIDAPDTSIARAYLGISCLGSPGPGAWAVRLERDDDSKVMTGGQPRTNANRLDLLGAIAALEAVPQGEAIQVFTGNSYLHDGITRWITGWKQNRWIKKTGGEVQYSDLWQRLDQLTQQRRVRWVLVSGSNRPAEMEALAEPLRQAVEAAKQMSR